MTVLLLTPSRGLGGGIERYVATVQDAFAARGIEHERLDLTRSGPAGQRRLLADATACLARQPRASRVVLAHRALLPVAAVLARRCDVAGTTVICHGSDVWGPRVGPRWYAESRLMRRPGVRVVTVSAFTAGALFPGCAATILPPGLSPDWFAELTRAGKDGRQSRPRPDGVELTSAFRLADWQDKGLATLTGAVAALGRPDVRLTICGSGEPPAGLSDHVRRYPWCTIRPGLSDRELAVQLARSDLFVLATRTRAGRRSCGEGFGMVLLEAQVAGTPVVGPAYGGSPDAYLDEVTGATPRDESVATLAGVLGRLLGDPERLAEMGARAAEWSRECFAPDRYAALAVDRLL
ncbi:MAG TPA: glycosyltransferase family 4 protein [Streptosporangiaceae bacterium]